MAKHNLSIFDMFQRLIQTLIVVRRELEAKLLRALYLPVTRANCLERSGSCRPHQDQEAAKPLRISMLGHRGLVRL